MLTAPGRGLATRVAQSAWCPAATTSALGSWTGASILSGTRSADPMDARASWRCGISAILELGRSTTRTVTARSTRGTPSIERSDPRTRTRRSDTTPPTPIRTVSAPTARPWGTSRPAAVSRFRLTVDAPNPSVNEVEGWHDTTRWSARLDAPDGTTSGWVRIGAVADLVSGERLIARVYHRGSDPQNPSNQVDAFIYPGAPAGGWLVWLRDDRSTGAPERFHAWIERDGCAHF